MDILIKIVFVFAVSIVLTSAIDLKLSVAIYLSYLILVPYLEFKIAGIPLSYNIINTLLFAIYIYHSLINKRYNVNFEFIVPFLVLYFSLLFLSLFTWIMPWGIQFNSWRASFMQTCFISFIVWNLANTDQKFLGFFKRSFIISITIAGVYGLFLMKMKGLNPYTTFLADYFGKDDVANNFSSMDARLAFSSASKIQATMAHPMTWALILCISMIVVMAFYVKTRNNKLWALIGLIGFNILISGVRTGIAAIAIGFIYFLIRYRNFKLIIITVIALFSFALIIQSSESMSNLFTSFTDFTGNKSDVNGSSITMRLNQLQGTIDEIKGTELVGKGYGWTNYYISLNGIHPVILAFESLLFMVLCNSGYIGLFIWILFFLMLYQLNRKILSVKTDIFLMDSMIVVYVAFAMGTGEYGYLPYFAIYYSFLLAYLANFKQSDTSPKQHFIKKRKKNYIDFDLESRKL